MSDNTPTLVHLEVEGAPPLVAEWTEYLKESSLDGYEFVVTRKGDAETRTVVERDQLVEDIADAVVERLEGDQ